MADALSLPLIGGTALDLDEAATCALGLASDSPPECLPLRLPLMKAGALSSYFRAVFAPTLPAKGNAGGPNGLYPEVALRPPDWSSAINYTSR